MLVVWLVYGKPDLSMMMPGTLAGLVAITAPCAYVSPAASMLIGAVALLDRVHMDDPVGAVPVHAMNGIWGTLAVGIWGKKSLGLARGGLLHGGGQQRGYRESYRGVMTEVNLLKQVRLEIAVNESFVKPTVDAIIRGARTGEIGDGKIFVVDLGECVRIRTGETGGDAIG
jgi:nitrogen regulatory protein PII